MARNGISYSDVKQAIEEMLSEGLNPTIAGLREKLGTGSFTTISEHLKHWRSERQQQPMVACGTSAPDNLNNMVQAVWQQAREDATRELESYKQEIQKTLDQAEAEKKQALEEAVATEERNKWLEEKNNALTEAIRELEKQKGALAVKLELSEEHHEELNAQLKSSKQEIAHQQQHIESLKENHRKELSRNDEKNRHERQKQLSDQQAALKLFEEQINEERKRSEASEQHWIKQIDLLRQQLKDKESHQNANEKKLLELNTLQHDQTKTVALALNELQTRLNSQSNIERENQNTLIALHKSLKGLEETGKEELNKLTLKSQEYFNRQEEYQAYLNDSVLELENKILKLEKSAK